MRTQVEQKKTFTVSITRNGTTKSVTFQAETTAKAIELFKKFFGVQPATLIVS